MGASEANLRRAIQTAEAVSPCILWIDEVEKGFSGVKSQSGGGVAARVFGTFLSWLQDKRSPVFVVATANDLSGIPPEFLHAGRFDAIFFLGLPDRIEREAILRIQMQKFRRDPSMFDVAALAAAGEGFSGAEIEQAVVGACSVRLKPVGKSRPWISPPRSARRCRFPDRAQARSRP